jgi:hypothetical protein
MTIEANSLEPGEQLLWRDRPDVKAYRERVPTRVWVALGLPAVGAAVVISYFQSGASSELQVLIATLLLGGIFSLCMPLRMWRESRQTEYALTDRRAIIERPGFVVRNRVSVPFSAIRHVELRNGTTTGDLIFRDFFQQSDHGLENTRDGFFAIANAQEVEQLLRAEVEKATGKPLAGGSK